MRPRSSMEERLDLEDKIEIVRLYSRNALMLMVESLSQNAEICKGLIFASKRRCLLRKIIMFNPYQMKYSLMHNSLGTPWPKGF